MFEEKFATWPNNLALKNQSYMQLITPTLRLYWDMNEKYKSQRS
jgi:hypothetical protein